MTSDKPDKPEQPDKPDKPDKPEPLDKPERPDKPTIVYIDADADNRQLVIEVLQVTNDYDLVGVGDGVTGLELIRERRPSIALVDLDLPVISAFELMRRLRAGEAPTSRTPLVAVSASVMKGERQRCVRAGFMAFVEKPFDIDELRSRVAECVRKSPIKPGA